MDHFYGAFSELDSLSPHLLSSNSHFHKKKIIQIEITFGWVVHFHFLVYPFGTTVNSWQIWPNSAIHTIKKKNTHHIKVSFQWKKTLVTAFNSRAELKYLVSSPSCSKETIIFLSGQHTVNQTIAPRVGSKTRCCSCEGQLDIAAMKYYTRLFSYSYASILAWKLQGNFKINLYNMHNVLMTAKSLGMKEATCHFSV